MQAESRDFTSTLAYIFSNRPKVPHHLEPLTWPHFSQPFFGSFSTCRSARAIWAGSERNPIAYRNIAEETFVVLLGREFEEKTVAGNLILYTAFLRCTNHSKRIMCGMQARINCDGTRIRTCSSICSATCSCIQWVNGWSIFIEYKISKSTSRAEVNSSLPLMHVHWIPIYLVRCLCQLAINLNDEMSIFACLEEGSKFGVTKADGAFAITCRAALQKL